MILARLLFLAASLFAVSLPTPVFTPPGDVLLQMRAEEVSASEILSEETQSIIDQMFLIARGERDESGEQPVMVGLAAPQIGYSKRIILVDVGVNDSKRELGSLIAYINPEITWYSEEIVEGREGCYSVDSRVIGLVPRSEKIRLKALDRNGLPISEEFSGLTAAIFQHEIDHLNGIRFPDRVGSEGTLQWVEEDEYAAYRENWKNWSCKCPWDTWVAMKSGEPYEAPLKQK
jgi:peptide deformylase